MDLRVDGVGLVSGIGAEEHIIEAYVTEVMIDACELHCSCGWTRTLTGKEMVESALSPQDLAKRLHDGEGDS